MNYTLQPLEFYSLNDFVIKDVWEISPGAPVSLYFVLQKIDQLGRRRFVPAAGTVASLQFLRARAASINSTSQNISKSATTVSADDKSLLKVDLTSDDTKNIISGSVQLVVTISGTAYTQVIPFAVKKAMNGPGF